MLKRISLVAAALLAAVFLSVGCASSDLLRPKQADIDAYLKANPGLPAVDLECINDGTFSIGMLASTVKFMLGEPKVIEESKEKWATQQVWKYKRGKKIPTFYIEDKNVVAIDEFNKK